MSDLRPKATTIKLGDKEYGLLFTLNAIDEIQDRFDISISELSDLMKDERKVYKVLRFLLATLINEAIDDSESGQPHVDERFIGRKITPANLSELQSGIFSAFTAGTPRINEDALPLATSEPTE